MIDKRILYLLLVVIFVLGTVLFIQSLGTNKKQNATKVETNLIDEKNVEIDLTEEENVENNDSIDEPNTTSKNDEKNTNTSSISPQETIQLYMNLLHLHQGTIDQKLEKMKPYITESLLNQMRHNSTNQHDDEEEIEQSKPTKTEIKNVEMIPQTSKNETIYLVQYDLIQTFEGSVFPSKMKAEYQLTKEKNKWKIATIRYQIVEEKSSEITSQSSEVKEIEVEAKDENYK